MPMIRKSGITLPRICRYSCMEAARKAQKPDESIHDPEWGSTYLVSLGIILP
jgi:hypothetical protein